MSHLDAHLKFQMLFDLKRLHRALKRTMIYVTHDQVEALALADRVAVMSDSRLQQVGTRNELYNRPANVFVADFIGEPPTNLFEAKLRGRGAARPSCRSTAPISPSRSRRSVRRRSPSVPTRRYILGIRPQNLRLANGAAGFDAEVLINEYLGERSILTARSGQASFRALVPPDTAARKGDGVRLAVDPQDVMVFDARSRTLVG